MIFSEMTFENGKVPLTESFIHVSTTITREGAVSEHGQCRLQLESSLV